MPALLLNELNAETVKMVTHPVFAQRLSDQGQDPQASTPAELSTYMRAESERFARVVKAAGVTAQ